MTAKRKTAPHTAEMKATESRWSWLVKNATTDYAAGLADFSDLIGFTTEHATARAQKEDK